MSIQKSGVPAPMDIFKQFPEDKYNRLLPAETYFDDIGPMQKASVDIVHISSDPEKKDVYKLKDRQYPLTKRGLAKIADAAGISFHPDFTRVVEHRPRDGYCLFKAVGAMKKADGTFRTLPGHYYIDLEEDKKDGMSDARLKERRKFIIQLCESGAMNRAIRELLAIKSHYTPEELKKPFAVPRIDFAPDLNDPEVKRFLLEQGAGAATQLYPPASAIPATHQIENGQVEAVPEASATDDDLDDFLEPEPSEAEAQVATFRVMDKDQQTSTFVATAKQKGLDLGTKDKPSELREIWKKDRVAAYEQALKGGE